MTVQVRTCAAVVAAMLAAAVAGCGDDEPTAREQRPTAAGRQSPAEAMRNRVSRSTVAITAQVGEDVVTSSGVVLDAERGLVLTSAHTVWGARSLKVTTDLGTLHGRLVARAACDGLALVETHPRLPGLVPVRIAAGDAARQRRGLTVFGWRFLVGRPQELAWAPVDRARAVRDEVVHPALPPLDVALRLPVPVMPGSSGGPVVDAEGRLVAMLMGEGPVERSPTRGWAVPAPRIRARLDELRPGPRTLFVGWEEQYACSQRLTRFAAAAHPGFVARDAALNAPVPATRLPGAGEVEGQ
jgi:S1-C subfamily serine protease